MFKKSITLLTVASVFTAISFSAAFAATDREIARSISSGISTIVNEPFSPSRVDVLTKDGTVYLRGSVEYQAQRAEVEQLAKATPGVDRVVNQLNLYSN